MKTLSVREVAAALEMTPRGVIQRLNKGQLKGTRRANQFGVQEWLVYANKEIMLAIEAKRGAGPGTDGQKFDFAPDENYTVDAEDVSYGDSEEEVDTPTNWRQIEMERLEVMAEKLVKPLTERLEAQALALREQEKVIEEQNRQLRLLPDLQKSAEKERKSAELKELEAEALKKQIAALQDQLEHKLVPEIRQQVEEELKQKDGELAALKQQLASLEAERQRAEALESRIAELQQSKVESEKAMQDEIERLRQEKDAHAQSVQEQLGLLTQKLERMEQPWWKRWFSAGETPNAT